MNTKETERRKHGCDGCHNKGTTERFEGYRKNNIWLCDKCLKELVKNGLQEDKWISVEDELPKKGLLINIAINNKVTAGKYFGDGLWIDKEDDEVIYGVVTHHQLLPKSPKPPIIKAIRED